MWSPRPVLRSPSSPPAHLLPGSPIRPPRAVQGDGEEGAEASPVSSSLFPGTERDPDPAGSTSPLRQVRGAKEHPKAEGSAHPFDAGEVTPTSLHPAHMSVHTRTRTYMYAHVRTLDMWNRGGVHPACSLETHTRTRARKSESEAGAACPPQRQDGGQGRSPHRGAMQDWHGVHVWEEPHGRLLGKEGNELMDEGHGINWMFKWENKKTAASKHTQKGIPSEVISKNRRDSGQRGTS